MRRVRWKWMAAPAAVLLVVGTVLAAEAAPALADTCTQVGNTEAACGPYLDSGLIGSDGNNTFVENDMWAANSGTTQTLTASSPESWSVDANAGPAGYTGVQTYPDVQQLLSGWDGTGWNSGGTGDTGTPVFALSSLTSDFDETMPTTSPTDAEAGYDIWVANAPSGYSNEIMIWNQAVNRGPGGGATQLATPTIGGVGYTLYENGGPGGELIFEMDSQESSGTADLLSPLDWLIANGYEQPDLQLAQIDYGWEICSTGAADETFTMSDYSLDATLSAASTIAPDAYPSGASGVTSDGATLNGTVNPNGQDSTYQFDYGTTTSYGTSVPDPAADAGSGSTAEGETALLTGLIPGTVYHYRIEATNASGTTYGQDSTFTTPAGFGSVLDDKTFEDGTNDNLQDWYGETSEVTTSEAHLGTHSLEIDATGSNAGQSDFSPNWGLQDAWPGQAQVTPGKDDLFTGWLLAGSGSATVTVAVTWRDADADAVGTTQAMTATVSSSGWTEFAGQFTPPSGAVTADETIGSADDGTFYLDDLAVTQLGTVLDNKSFEDGTNDNLDDWYGETSEVTDAQAFMGSDSLEVENSSDNGYWGVATAWPGQADVTPGDDDAFFGWLKAASGSDTLYVNIYFLDSGGDQVGSTQTITATDNATGWTEFDGQYVVPAGAATAYETISTNDGSTDYIDNVEVVTP
jgi:hypothetical protein